MGKKCVICGVDCDGQPRYQDEQGHYLHVSCAEPQVGGPSAPTYPMEMAGAPTKTATSSIRLWNPNVASCLSLFFTPAFGAWLHAVNWRSLGENDKARQSMKSQQERSFSLTSTQNLHNASRLLNEQNYDVILTDINLSDASGFVVIEELIKHGDHTPIVVLSNITNWSMILETAQIGISDFLLKRQLMREL